MNRMGRSGLFFLILAKAGHTYPHPRMMIPADRRLTRMFSAI